MKLDQILEMPNVAKRTTLLNQVAAANSALAEGKLLGTILIPRNLLVLSSRLPKPNYPNPRPLKRYEADSHTIQQRARSIVSCKNEDAVLKSMDQPPKQQQQSKKRVVYRRINSQVEDENANIYNIRPRADSVDEGNKIGKNDNLSTKEKEKERVNKDNERYQNQIPRPPLMPKNNNNNNPMKQAGLAVLEKPYYNLVQRYWK